jgi:predicted membrane-bound mannosyltransferase/DNA-binding beta-propeller fold protein YncE
MTELTTTPTDTEQDFLSRPLLTTLSLDWEKAIYIAFIVVAIITRFWDLGSRVMSHDESLHTQFSYQFYNGDGFNHTPLMHGPFLFHITAVSYWLFGDSDLSARIPVAIFGVLLVFMPYLLRRWLGPIGALFTSFIFLISPYITYYSRYIRHDIYVIVWSIIVLVAIWSYIRQREEKFLWWFAAGTALMFSTKEVAFIYVAIFGSFLVLRLLVRVGSAEWFRQAVPKLRSTLFLVLAGLLLISGGFLGQWSSRQSDETAATGEVTEGFAADPNQELPVETEETATGTDRLSRWVLVGGIGVLSLGLFLTARAMRPNIDDHPEFDLIILLTTFVLPMASPFLTTFAGWNPRDYTISKCILEGQESMTSLQLLLGRMGNSVCWSSFLSSGVVRSGGFLILTLIVATLVGLWWNRKKWLVAAAIFHAVFAVLYTSVFTNPGGWTSGMIDSLGYWLEQQDVQRGSQPETYYFFVVPFYEFLSVIFSLAAAHLWLRRKKLNKIVSYWAGLIVSAFLVFSLSNWLINRGALPADAEPSSTLGAILALLVLGAGVLFWFFARYRQLLREYELRDLRGLVDVQSLIGFVPFLIWWLLLTVVIYSYAGEKMPWLSTHFVIPMALLAGWYFNERLAGLNLQKLFSRTALQLSGLTIVLVVAATLALGPLLLGTFQLGNQQADNLNTVGRFLGSFVLAGGLFYLWRQRYLSEDKELRRPIITLGFFGLLSLLTIRFSYMASFPNADSSSEFMVYAHGAPATKNVVMQQVEELSMRMYGDKSIKVAFSSDASWPFTWYLRDYPNRLFYADNPSHSLTDSPVIIAGSLDWADTEPYLGNDYEHNTYTYLWWPMEEYRKFLGDIWGKRKFSWNAIFGDPTMADQRGLGNPGVRQALWDIFFYRDYNRYGEVFGGTYTAGQWPLRHEMRLYVRKDALAGLWDFGIGAVSAEGLQDPYAENVLQLSPVMVINESGIGGAGEGELFAPRNVDIGPDGRVYVADSGNHRIQVYDADGSFLDQWGGSGTEPGRFNEPWGLLVTDDHVYVADTWNHRIQKFTLDGVLVGVFGVSGSPTEESAESLGLFFGPRDIIRLDDGNLLVTDTGNHRIQIMDEDGNFIRQVGGFGNLLGQLNEPVGLGISPDGSFFLADTWNSRIQRFSPDLFAINEWAVDAWDGTSTNNKPYLATDSAGRLFVTDPEGYRVLMFSGLGDYLGRFGGFGTDINSLGLPNGIAIDGEDNLYIADAGNHRILKFAPVFGVPQGPADDVEEPIDERNVEVDEVEEGAGEGQPTEVGGEQESEPVPPETEDDLSP